MTAPKTNLSNGTILVHMMYDLLIIFLKTSGKIKNILVENLENL
jgi:hypothetical protein